MLSTKMFYFDFHGWLSGFLHSMQGSVILFENLD